jgi:uncharacterized membrane protein YeiH
MSTDSTLLVALDLTGTFAFALNGALAAIRVTRLDVVGIVTVGMVTALGGGILRDVFIDALPPATFIDWRYLVVAATGSLVAFALGTRLDSLARPITVLDAAGLSLFAVSGASKALEYDMGAGQAVILGAITAVGGGTLRDVLIGRVPVVLRSELYAIPALVAALLVVLAEQGGVLGAPAAVGAALLCFAIRLLALRFDLHAPSPPSGAPDGSRS